MCARISSINRFERKKDLYRALHAFVQLLCLLKSSDVNKSQLIMAGGYDSRINENVDYLKELARYFFFCKIDFLSR